MNTPVRRDLGSIGQIRTVLAENLQRLLRQRGWDSERLARQSRVAVRTVRNILNCAHDVQLNNLEKIAVSLGVPAWMLLLRFEDRDLAHLVEAYMNANERGRMMLQIATEAAAAIKSGKT